MTINTNLSANSTLRAGRRVGALLTLSVAAGLAAYFLQVATAAPGELDPTFNGTGKKVTGLGFGSDSAQEMVVQPDGKFVVAGSTFNGSKSDFAVVRYTASGTLDPTFGTNGAVITNVGTANPANASGTCVALQADGKIVVGGAARVSSIDQFALVRYNTDGSLDTTFDTDGKVTTDIGTSTDFASAVAVLPDGKILLGGSATTGANTDLAIVKYNTNGSLDTTFDGDGKLTTSIGSGADNIADMAIQTDGKMVVVGSATIGSDVQTMVARFNANGTLDTTFNTTGFVTDGTFFGANSFSTVALQPDGKIVAAGSNAAFFRYNPNGSLDTTFAGDGTSSSPYFHFETTVRDIAIQSDGKILGAGIVSGSGIPANFGVVRLNADGSRDTGFGPDGYTLTDFYNSSDAAVAVAVRADGKIVAAGRALNGTHDDFAIARFSSTGLIDTTFDTDGKQAHNIGDSTVSVRGSAIQPDGKIVVVGVAYNGQSNDFVVARYNDNGSLDTLFGSNGVVLTNFATSEQSDAANAVVLQPDGKVVVAGSAVNVSQPEFAIARYNTNGTLDTSFDTDGKVTRSIGATFFGVEAFAIALQADGKIVAVGGGGDFGVLRYNSNGSQDNTFDGDGFASADFGTDSDRARSVKIQPDGKIVVGGHSITDTFTLFAVARFNTNGSLDTTFDGDGKATTGFVGFGDGPANAMALQEDGKIVLAGHAQSGSGTDFALARFNSNGSLDTAFDGDGKVLTDFASSNDRATAVAVDANGRIILAGFSTLSGNTNFALARYNTNGSLDSTFGTGGKSTYELGGADSINALVIDASARLFVAGSSGSLIGMARILTTGPPAATPTPTPTVTPTPTPTPTPAPGGSISGVVSYGTTPVGQSAKFVPGVLLAAAGSVPVNASTNVGGAYSLSGLGSGSYTVTPSKSGDVNGISALDASRVAQHAAGLIVLTPNQILAGDATNNGTLSALDASRIAQFAAGITNPGIAGQWKFLPASRNYASVTGAVGNQNYEAILVGDVTGNWTPPTARMIIDKESTIWDPAPWDLLGQKHSDKAHVVDVELPGNVTAATGTSVTLPIPIGDATGGGIIAYEFTLDFDPDVLSPTLEPINTGGTLSDGWSAIVNSEVRGQITVTAYSTQELTGVGTLLNLNFIVIGQGGASTPLEWTRFKLNENEISLEPGRPARP